MKLQFFPDVSTQLADVSARRVQSSLPAMPCLKRLRLENLKRSDEDAESVEENGKLSGRAVESHSQKNQTDDQPASSTSSTFSVLDVSKLRNGLSESMVDDISITELFYLCGMNPEIHLLYSTNVERNSSREPWKEFVSLISRNYGSSLCKNIDGPEDVDEVRQVMVTLEDRKRKEKTLISGSTSNNKETDIGQTEDDPQKGSTTNAEGSSNSVKPVSAPIVECENRAFMRQLEGLQLKKRPRTLVVQPSKNGTSLAASMKRFHHASSSNETALVNQQQQPVAGTYISEPPISIGSAGRVQQAAATHYVVLPPNTQIVQGPPSFIGTVGSGSVTQFFNFPTVSAVGTVRQMNSSEMNRTPEREAESHRQHEFSATPNTQFAAQVLTTMSGQVEPTTSTSNDDLFSDSYCVSNTNGAEHSTVYPIFAVPQDSVHYVIVDQSSTNSLSISPEKIFTELNTVDVNMGASAVSSTCADISQNSSNKTLGNLPDDVRHSFEMCMQQNSIDYCRNFEQLVTSFETTPKNAP
ncbi:hypothetical protein AB6A40_007163 [Gnathostoma spinigerum]|uniref:Uncharacterized protein n=1 Tax=Gnathostoma spinigerum TaxID=75299 RepID=A0ABD6EQK4_9BILA